MCVLHKRTDVYTAVCAPPAGTWRSRRRTPTRTAPPTRTQVRVLQRGGAAEEAVADPVGQLQLQANITTPPAADAVFIRRPIDGPTGAASDVRPRGASRLLANG